MDPKTTITLPELGTREDCGRHNGVAQLEMTTGKYSNGQIVSSASVTWLYPDGGIIFEMFGDFRKTVLRSAGRATQKVLNQQHATAFNPDYVTLLKAETVAFYAAKAAKREAA